MDSYLVWREECLDVVPPHSKIRVATFVDAAMRSLIKKAVRKTQLIVMSEDETLDECLQILDRIDNEINILQQELITALEEQQALKNELDNIPKVQPSPREIRRNQYRPESIYINKGDKRKTKKKLEKKDETVSKIQGNLLNLNTIRRALQSKIV